MSATREYRNACLIEEEVEKAHTAIAEATALHKKLASVLPDEFPVIHEELGAAETAVDNLLTKIGG